MSMDWHPITTKPWKKGVIFFARFTPKGTLLEHDLAYSLTEAKHLMRRMNGWATRERFTHWTYITPPEREA